MFYKSMTSDADPRIWQEVCHVPHRSRLLYVEFTCVETAGSRSCR